MVIGVVSYSIEGKSLKVKLIKHEEEIKFHAESQRSLRKRNLKDKTKDISFYSLYVLLEE